MIVVSDTSPFNYLVLIEAVEILSAIFGRILVTPAVVEVLQAPETPDAVKAWIANPPALARGSKSRIDWHEPPTWSG